MAEVYYSRRIQSKPTKRKGAEGEVQRKPGTSSQVFSPSRVTQGEYPAISSNDMQSTVYREARKPPCAQGFYQMAGRITAFCLARAQILASQKERLPFLVHAV